MDASISGFCCPNSIQFYESPARGVHPPLISDWHADLFEGALLAMCVSPPDRDRKVPPTSAALEAEYQRKVAIGWLYRAEITSDDTLRASYERIARQHFQLAEAEEARLDRR